MNKFFQTSISILALLAIAFSMPTQAVEEISDNKYQAIEKKVQAMNYNQLISIDLA